MTLQNLEIIYFEKTFQTVLWEKEKHSRHLLVRLNLKLKSNLNSLFKFIKILHFYETYHD